MLDPAVKMAFEAARSRLGTSTWLALAPRDQTEAVYQELRRIDAETADRLAQPSDGHQRLAS
jgi:hypothetical protein